MCLSFHLVFCRVKLTQGYTSTYYLSSNLKKIIEEYKKWSYLGSQICNLLLFRSCMVNVQCSFLCNIALQQKKWIVIKDMYSVHLEYKNLHKYEGRCCMTQKKLHILDQSFLVDKPTKSI